MDLEVLEAYAQLKLDLQQRTIYIGELILKVKNLENQLEQRLSRENVKAMFDVYGDTLFIKEQSKGAIINWLNNNGPVPDIDHTNNTDEEG